MIILDTNVVFEPLKPRPDPAVIAWLNSRAMERLYLTATRLAELLVGVEITPEGKRKRMLRAAVDDVVERLFSSRILAFDHHAAVIFAALEGKCRLQGVSVSMADAQIAAIAQVHGFRVATRDVGPFAAVGLPVVNPWAPTS